MTEREYILTCLGFNSIHTTKLQHLRKLCWTMICGYADPKKLPRNEIAWWPLGTDPVPKPMSHNKIIKLHTKFLNFRK